MAPQTIQDAYNEYEPYSFDPLPPPDHIARTVKRLNLDDGVIYEGEVDEQDRPDGRGIKVVPSKSFYEGYFMNGNRNGRGRLINERQVYIGD